MPLAAVVEADDEAFESVFSSPLLPIPFEVDTTTGMGAGGGKAKPPTPRPRRPRLAPPGNSVGCMEAAEGPLACIRVLPYPPYPAALAPVNGKPSEEISVCEDASRTPEN